MKNRILIGTVASEQGDGLLDLCDQDILRAGEVAMRDPSGIYGVQDCKTARLGKTGVDRSVT